jgi:hypothetical protein
MAEWLNALPWKGSIGVTQSGVRIPLSPQNNKHNAKALCECVLRERGGFEPKRRGPCGPTRVGVERMRFYERSEVKSMRVTEPLSPQRT